MKQWLEESKKLIMWLFLAALFGYCVGKFYTIDSIITDCKVLGMTRFGSTPMGCRVGEKYQ